MSSPSKSRFATLIEFTDRYYLPILILLPLIFFAVGFFEDGINVDSTTYSVIARNMTETGRWLVPSYTPYFATQFAEHPPFVMWIHGLIFILFGAADPTTRIFGALCTIGCIIIVFFIGKNVRNRGYGFLSGAILLLTYNFIQMGNSAMLDMPLIFFTLVGIYSLVTLIDDDKKSGWWFLLGLMLGVTFMTKGVVAVPLWLTVLFTAAFWRRRWFKNYRLYISILIGLGIIIIYSILDHIYAAGYFRHHYFGTQIAKSLAATDTVQKADWYSYIMKFIRLYLPFIILLPAGIYIALKKKMLKLYPVISGLLVFIVFHSAAGKILYHYFIPAYALSAPLVALPLAGLLKESMIKKIALGLTLIWLAGVIIVAAADIKIHPIRSPEIYNLTDTMAAYLDNQKSRDGLIIAERKPNWDYVAKTTWYWRSDVKKVVNFDQAAEQLHNNDHFVYILADGHNRKSDEELHRLQLNRLTGNDKIEIYVP